MTLSSDRAFYRFWLPLVIVLLVIVIWRQQPEWERRTDGPLADWWAAEVCGRL